MKRYFKATATFLAPQGGFTATAFSTSPKKAIRAARAASEDKAIERGATNWGGDWITLTNPYGKIVFSDLV